MSRDHFHIDLDVMSVCIVGLITHSPICLLLIIKMGFEPSIRLGPLGLGLLLGLGFLLGIGFLLGTGFLLGIGFP